MLKLHNPNETAEHSAKLEAVEYGLETFCLNSYDDWYRIPIPYRERIKAKLITLLHQEITMWINRRKG